MEGSDPGIQCYAVGVWGFCSYVEGRGEEGEGEDLVTAVLCCAVGRREGFLRSGLFLKKS